METHKLATKITALLVASSLFLPSPALALRVEEASETDVLTALKRAIVRVVRKAGLTSPTSLPTPALPATGLEGAAGLESVSIETVWEFKEQDFEAVLSLATQFFLEIGVGSREEAETFARFHLQRRSLKTAAIGSFFVIAREPDGVTPIAFSEVSWGSDRLQADLNRVFVLPSFRGREIPRGMFQHVLERIPEELPSVQMVSIQDSSKKGNLAPALRAAAESLGLKGDDQGERNHYYVSLKDDRKAPLSAGLEGGFVIEGGNIHVREAVKKAQLLIESGEIDAVVSQGVALAGDDLTDKAKIEERADVVQEASWVQFGIKGKTVGFFPPAVVKVAPRVQSAVVKAAPRVQSAFSSEGVVTSYHVSLDREVKKLHTSFAFGSGSRQPFHSYRGTVSSVFVIVPQYSSWEGRRGRVKIKDEYYVARLMDEGKGVLVQRHGNVSELVTVEWGGLSPSTFSPRKSQLLSGNMEVSSTRRGNLKISWQKGYSPPTYKIYAAIPLAAGMEGGWKRVASGTRFKKDHEIRVGEVVYVIKKIYFEAGTVVLSHSSKSGADLKSLNGKTVSRAQLMQMHAEHRTSQRDPFREFNKPLTVKAARAVVASLAKQKDSLKLENVIFHFGFDNRASTGERPLSRTEMAEIADAMKAVANLSPRTDKKKVFLRRGASSGKESQQAIHVWPALMDEVEAAGEAGQTPLSLQEASAELSERLVAALRSPTYVQQVLFRESVSSSEYRAVPAPVVSLEHGESARNQNLAQVLSLSDTGRIILTGPIKLDGKLVIKVDPAQKAGPEGWRRLTKEELEVVTARLDQWRWQLRQSDGFVFEIDYERTLGPTKAYLRYVPSEGEQSKRRRGLDRKDVNLVARASDGDWEVRRLPLAAGMEEVLADFAPDQNVKLEPEEAKKLLRRRLLTGWPAIIKQSTVRYAGSHRSRPSLFSGNITIELGRDGEIQRKIGTRGRAYHWGPLFKTGEGFLVVGKNQRIALAEMISGDQASARDRQLQSVLDRLPTVDSMGNILAAGMEGERAGGQELEEPLTVDLAFDTIMAAIGDAGSRKRGKLKVSFPHGVDSILFGRAYKDPEKLRSLLQQAFKQSFWGMTIERRAGSFVLIANEPPVIAVPKEAAVPQKLATVTIQSAASEIGGYPLEGTLTLADEQQTQYLVKRVLAGGVLAQKIRDGKPGNTEALKSDQLAGATYEYVAPAAGMEQELEEEGRFYALYVIFRDLSDQLITNWLSTKRNALLGGAQTFPAYVRNFAAQVEAGGQHVISARGLDPKEISEKLVYLYLTEPTQSSGLISPEQELTYAMAPIIFTRILARYQRNASLDGPEIFREVFENFADPVRKASEGRLQPVELNVDTMLMAKQFVERAIGVVEVPDQAGMEEWKESDAKEYIGGESPNWVVKRQISEMLLSLEEAREEALAVLRAGDSDETSRAFAAMAFNSYFYGDQGQKLFYLREYGNFFLDDSELAADAPEISTFLKLTQQIKDSIKTFKSSSKFETGYLGTKVRDELELAQANAAELRGLLDELGTLVRSPSFSGKMSGYRNDEGEPYDKIFLDALEPAQNVLTEHEWILQSYLAAGMEGGKRSEKLEVRSEKAGLETPDDLVATLESGSAHERIEVARELSQNPVLVGNVSGLIRALTRNLHLPNSFYGSDEVRPSARKALEEYADALESGSLLQQELTLRVLVALLNHGHQFEAIRILLQKLHEKGFYASDVYKKAADLVGARIVSYESFRMSGPLEMDSPVSRPSVVFLIDQEVAKGVGINRWASQVERNVPAGHLGDLLAFWVVEADSLEHDSHFAFLVLDGLKENRFELWVKGERSDDYSQTFQEGDEIQLVPAAGLEQAGVITAVAPYEIPEFLRRAFEGFGFKPSTKRMYRVLIFDPEVAHLGRLVAELIDGKKADPVVLIARDAEHETALLQSGFGGVIVRLDRFDNDIKQARKAATIMFEHFFGIKRPPDEYQYYTAEEEQDLLLWLSDLLDDYDIPSSALSKRQAERLLQALTRLRAA